MATALYGPSPLAELFVILQMHRHLQEAQLRMIESNACLTEAENRMRLVYKQQAKVDQSMRELRASRN